MGRFDLVSVEILIRTHRLIALFVFFLFSCVFVWSISPSVASAAPSIISQSSGVSQPYTAWLGGNVYINNPYFFVATGTLSSIAFPAAVYRTALSGTETFQFKLYNYYFSRFLDCQTPIKTMDEWGITHTPRDPNAPVVTFGPFTGTQCDIGVDTMPGGPTSIMAWPFRDGKFEGTDVPGMMGNGFRANVIAYGADIPPPPDPCANESCVSNVLFLPGLEASRLYRPDYSGGTDQLWEPNASSDANDLLLTVDGKSVRKDVYTKDVIDEKNVLPVGQGNIYKSFLNDLYKWKNTDFLIADYAVAPYDWRLSLDEILSSGNQFPDGRIYYSGDLAATSSPYIIQELRRLAKSSKTGKVTIVAHSNGGLVAKALTEKLGSEASTLIDKIIFIAVPQAGTPQAIGAILHGYDQGLPFDSLPLVLTPEAARTFAENMPSAYNLLPSASYFTYTDDPVVAFDNSDFLAEFRARYGNKIHDGALLKNFITDPRRLASSTPGDLAYPSVGNAALLSRAETLHTTLDAWAPPQGVSLYEVAGWGEDTLSTIEYTEGKKTICGNPSASTCQYYTTVSTLMYSPKEVIEGDGTVLVPSALWTTASTTAAKYWVDLLGYNSDLPQSLFRLDLKHAEILEVPSLRTLVQNILTNSTSTTPLSFISTNQPATDAAANKRLRFVLHSPLNLSATDNLGNTVNSATSTILGSRFKRYGEVQVLTVPKNTPITLNLDGYAAGSFTLDMQEIDGSNVITASSTFSAIPSATSTKATMAFTDGTIQNASPLLLDYDGNGTTDFSFTSKIGETTVFDVTPPEAILTFDPILQQLKIVGADNLSSTAVSTTATSTTITDEAGNSLEVIFQQLKQNGNELKLEIQALRYNGVLTAGIPKTVLQYEWSTDKTSSVRELEEKATVGNLKIEGHYSAKKNVTKIEEKMKYVEDKDEKGSKRILPGLALFKFSTDKGKVEISY